MSPMQPTPPRRRGFDAAELDLALMDEARIRAARSTYRSRQVGCVIATACGHILAEGWNTVPNGCVHTEARHARPAKYVWTERAERNAIYQAAREGVPLRIAVAYVPSYPCADCARGLIHAGIARLVAHEPDFEDPKWGADFRMVEEMLVEAGVSVSLLPDEAAGAQAATAEREVA